MAIKQSPAREYGAGFIIKLILMAAVNAIGVYGIFLAISVEHWIITAVIIAGLVVVNLVYFLPTKKIIPAKYLLPGLVFLLVYQIFTVGYTAYTAFTNYGDGHNSSKEDAISAIMQRDETRIPDSPTVRISVVEVEGELGFTYVSDAGPIMIGFAEQPFEPIEGASATDGKVDGVPDGQVLTFAQISNRAQEVTALRVPISDDPNDGSMRTNDGSNGYLASSTLFYDHEADVLRNTETGEEFRPNDHGNFESSDGTVLLPGWKVTVGFENFTTMITGGKFSSEFFTVLAWTVAFAFLSVATTFILGLGMALLFNSDSMRGRKVYRSILILPYAFPGFLSALVWAGMLNRDHGFINDIFFGGSSIGWLMEPTLAKISVLGVNLWLGFPYMFLISTGALQSIDKSLYESARVDGANAFQQSKSITFPMLMIATAPLLISSFAFNFNNFNLIYMLTEGGPRSLTSESGVGATDILITYTYKVAFSGGLQQHGLASAISILIFLIVATVSVIGFRQTRKLEELM